jgi:hypothetical protein
VSERDDDLHDARISALYRELPKAEPDAATDELIRAEARRAVQAGPRRLGLSFAARRLFATAAMLLLGVGLVLHLQVREPQVLQQAITARAPVETPPRQEQAVVAEKETMRAEASAEDHSDAGVNAMFLEESSGTGTTAGNVTARRAPAPAAPPASAVAPPEAVPEAEVPPAGLALKPAADVAVEDRGAAAAPNPEGQTATTPRPGERSAAQEFAKRSEKAAQRALPMAQVREHKAELARVAADYRTLMADGQYAEALNALGEAGTANAPVDRDLLRLLVGQAPKPACREQPALLSAGEKQLCDYLSLHAEGRPLPADWWQQLESQGLVSGDREYRRRAVKALLAP